MIPEPKGPHFEDNISKGTTNFQINQNEWSVGLLVTKQIFLTAHPKWPFINLSGKSPQHNNLRSLSLEVSYEYITGIIYLKVFGESLIWCY